MIEIEVDAETFLAAFEPAPELVAVQPVTPRQVCEAIEMMGLLSDPDCRWFRPAVRA